MSKIRVLVVDDSALSRALLTETLSKDSGIEVAYAAPNATLALGYLEKNQLDLVVLDVEMPKIDGIETLRRIRKSGNTIPVLMCSSLTLRGAETTLTALSEGASDYIGKPSASFPREDFEREITAKVHALCGSKVAATAPAPERPPVARIVPRAPARAPSGGRPRAVAIGCSTGGPNALAVVFAELFRPLSVPMFIVQHMPPLFTKLLAERLAAQSGQIVKEGEHGEVVKPGICYLAPGGSHMTVARDKTDVRIVLNEDPPENFCRPAVDVLFRGLAQVYGGDVFATVLTGMGHDGSLGAQALVEVGARVVVQDPDTCVVPSMPSGVISAGAAHATLPLEEIGRELDRVGNGSPPKAVGGMR